MMYRRIDVRDYHHVSFRVECQASGGYWYPYETYQSILDALECVRDMPLALQLSRVRIASMHNDTVTDTRMYSLESVNRDIAFWQACADASSTRKDASQSTIDHDRAPYHNCPGCYSETANYHDADHYGHACQYARQAAEDAWVSGINEPINVDLYPYA